MDIMLRYEFTANRTTALFIKASLRVSGFNASLFKKKDRKTTDEVYGIYGGSELTTNIDVYSLYDTANPTVIDLTPEEENINPQTISTEINIDESFEEPIQIPVLIGPSQWRQIESMSSGFLEDPAVLWTDYLDVYPGDVIQIDRADNSSFRLKVIGAETLGATTDIVTRFKISNIGD